MEEVKDTTARSAYPETTAARTQGRKPHRRPAVRSSRSAAARGKHHMNGHQASPPRITRYRSGGSSSVAPAASILLPPSRGSSSILSARPLGTQLCAPYPRRLSLGRPARWRGPPRTLPSTLHGAMRSRGFQAVRVAVARGRPGETRRRSATDPSARRSL